MPKKSPDNTTLLSSQGFILSRLRSDNNLTLKQLATKSGLNCTRLFRLESRKSYATIRELIKLSCVYEQDIFNKIVKYDTEREL